MPRIEVGKPFPGNLNEGVTALMEIAPVAATGHDTQARLVNSSGRATGTLPARPR
jgi:hypothetical protein